MSPADLRESARLLWVLAAALDEEARRAPVARDGCRRVAGAARALAEGLDELACDAPPTAERVATCPGARSTCLRAAADAVWAQEKQAGASEMLGLLSRGEAAGPFDGAF